MLKLAEENMALKRACDVGPVPHVEEDVLDTALQQYIDSVVDADFMSFGDYTGTLEKASAIRASSLVKAWALGSRLFKAQPCGRISPDQLKAGFQRAISRNQSRNLVPKGMSSKTFLAEVVTITITILNHARRLMNPKRFQEALWKLDPALTQQMSNIRDEVSLCIGSSSDNDAVDLASLSVPSSWLGDPAADVAPLEDKDDDDAHVALDTNGWPIESCSDPDSGEKTTPCKKLRPLSSDASDVSNISLDSQGWPKMLADNEISTDTGGMYTDPNVKVKKLKVKDCSDDEKETPEKIAQSALLMALNVARQALPGGRTALKSKVLKKPSSSSNSQTAESPSFGTIRCETYTEKSYIRMLLPNGAWQSIVNVQGFPQHDQVAKMLFDDALKADMTRDKLASLKGEYRAAYTAELKHEDEVHNADGSDHDLCENGDLKNETCWDNDLDDD